MTSLFLSLSACVLCAVLFFTVLYGGRAIAQGKTKKRRKSVVTSSTSSTTPNPNTRFHIHISRTPDQSPPPRPGPLRRAPAVTGSSGENSPTHTAESSEDEDDVFSFPMMEGCLKHLTKDRISSFALSRRRSPSATFLREFSQHENKFSIRPIIMSS